MNAIDYWNSRAHTLKTKFLSFAWFFLLQRSFMIPLCLENVKHGRAVLFQPCFAGFCESNLLRSGHKFMLYTTVCVPTRAFCILKEEACSEEEKVKRKNTSVASLKYASDIYQAKISGGTVVGNIRSPIKPATFIPPKPAKHLFVSASGDTTLVFRKARH